MYLNSVNSKLSPSAIEASHPGLMKQFELYAIISQPIALMSVAVCQVSKPVRDKAWPDTPPALPLKFKLSGDLNPVLTSAFQQVAGM